jgi:hypothetical protein
MYEATVTAELGRLVASADWRRSAANAPAAPPDHHRTITIQPPWRDVALRRDGARPLRIRGLLIHRTEVREAGGRSVLRIFATDDGGAVAQLAYEPPDGCPARPVYRVTRLGGREDLRRFLEREGPEQCFAVHEPVSPLSEAHETCDRMRLPVNLPGLVRADELSPYTHEGTQ